jgi:hypothetical protein
MITRMHALRPVGRSRKRAARLLTSGFRSLTTAIAANLAMPPPPFGPCLGRRLRRGEKGNARVYHSTSKWCASKRARGRQPSPETIAQWESLAHTIDGVPLSSPTHAAIRFEVTTESATPNDLAWHFSACLALRGLRTFFLLRRAEHFKFACKRFTAEYAFQAFHRVSPRFTAFHRVSPRFMRFTAFHCVSLRFTAFHKWGVPVKREIVKRSSSGKVLAVRPR